MPDKLLKDARLIRAMRSAGVNEEQRSDTLFFLDNPDCSPEEYAAFKRRLKEAFNASGRHRKK